MKIVESGEWPDFWKVEHGVPIGKNSDPKDEDDLRIISLSPWLSKVMEKFVMEWLMEFIGDKIDLKQF